MEEVPLPAPESLAAGITECDGILCLQDRDDRGRDLDRLGLIRSLAVATEVAKISTNPDLSLSRCFATSCACRPDNRAATACGLVAGLSTSAGDTLTTMLTGFCSKPTWVGLCGVGVLLTVGLGVGLWVDVAAGTAGCEEKATINRTRNRSANSQPASNGTRRMP